MILYNEFEPFSKLVNSEFYNDSEIFQNWLHQEDEEVRKKILGSLEFLAIKNGQSKHKIITQLTHSSAKTTTTKPGQASFLKVKF